MSNIDYAYVRIGTDRQPYVLRPGLHLHSVVLAYKQGMLVETVAAEFALPVSAVHSALAYYYDHAEAVEAEIARREQLADRLRDELEDPELQDRLARVKRRRVDRSEYDSGETVRRRA